MLEPEELNYDETPEEAGNNRTFILAAGGMAALVLISLACIAVYVLFINPRNQATNSAAEATTVAQNATVESALTGTAYVQAFTPTSLPTATPTETLVPTATPVVVQEEAIVTPNVTETLAVAHTAAAQAQLTIIPTSSALPVGGIADDLGLPGLGVMALAFVLVILLARRLITAPATH